MVLNTSIPAGLEAIIFKLQKKFFNSVPDTPANDLIILKTGSISENTREKI